MWAWAAAGLVWGSPTSAPDAGERGRGRERDERESLEIVQLLIDGAPRGKMKGEFVFRPTSPERKGDETSKSQTERRKGHVAKGPCCSSKSSLCCLFMNLIDSGERLQAGASWILPHLLGGTGPESADTYINSQIHRQTGRMDIHIHKLTDTQTNRTQTYTCICACLRKHAHEQTH